MKITLITAGKTDVKYLKEGLEYYIKKLKFYTQFVMREIPGLKNTKNLSPGEVSEKEGQKILKEIEKHDYVVLLDEKGHSFRSVDFAKFIEEKAFQNKRSIAFVVGGAYGFSPEVYKKSDYKISLSNMTFSHQMVRLFFLEQLYRAFTIIRNEPYHNE